MKLKINIDTLSDINRFVAICASKNFPIHLTDGEHYTVSAKSLLGAIATMDWSEVYVTCDQDIHVDLMDFMAD